jgi:hypothetical protein
MPTTFDELAERYIAIWNETDPARRRRDIDDLWAPDARYVDPLAVAEGQVPGMTFRLAGPVDGHHNQARFTWELGLEDVEALIVGFDIATTDGNGRLSQVLGFLDRVPAA